MAGELSEEEFHLQRIHDWLTQLPDADSGQSDEMDDDPRSRGDGQEGGSIPDVRHTPGSALYSFDEIRQSLAEVE